MRLKWLLSSVIVIVSAQAAPLPLPSAFVRINQAGYTPDSRKIVFLMANQPETGAEFSVFAGNHETILSGAVPAKYVKWNSQFPYVYPLDLGSITQPGTYYVVITGPFPARSSAIRVASAATIYGPLVQNAAHFYAAQTDQHTSDAAAKVYETPAYNSDQLRGALRPIGKSIDISGGWYDAGDYVEFVETTSYTDAALLMAARDYPRSAIAAAAHQGLLWLLKMWDPHTRTLYYQVGIGDGNNKIHGDHDAWRLPEADNALHVSPGDADYFVKYRPVFRAGPPGMPISPNLAGRLAAAFALGYQVYRDSDSTLAAQCLAAARTVFATAQTEHVHGLLTTAPYSYYPETEWRDDLEWGATELFHATGEMNFLQSAAHWARAYLNSSAGGDTPNLYDIGGIAHYELAVAIMHAGNRADKLDVTEDDLVNALRAQLSAASKMRSNDAFGLAIPYDAGDFTPHVIGVALEASLYRQLTGSNAFDPLMQAQLSWVLGGNAWGVVSSSVPVQIIRGTCITKLPISPAFRWSAPWSMARAIRSKWRLSSSIFRMALKTRETFPIRTMICPITPYVSRTTLAIGPASNPRSIMPR